MCPGLNEVPYHLSSQITVNMQGPLTIHLSSCYIRFTANRPLRTKALLLQTKICNLGGDWSYTKPIKKYKWIYAAFYNNNTTYSRLASS